MSRSRRGRTYKAKQVLNDAHSPHLPGNQRKPLKNKKLRDELRQRRRATRTAEMGRETFAETVDRPDGIGVLQGLGGNVENEVAYAGLLSAERLLNDLVWSWHVGRGHLAGGSVGAGGDGTAALGRVQRCRMFPRCRPDAAHPTRPPCTPGRRAATHGGCAYRAPVLKLQTTPGVVPLLFTSSIRQVGVTGPPAPRTPESRCGSHSSASAPASRRRP
jgi:hypothetical protein